MGEPIVGRTGRGRVMTEVHTHQPAVVVTRSTEDGGGVGMMVGVVLGVVLVVVVGWFLLASTVFSTGMMQGRMDININPGPVDVTVKPPVEVPALVPQVPALPAPGAVPAP